MTPASGDGERGHRHGLGVAPRSTRGPRPMRRRSVSGGAAAPPVSTSNPCIHAISRSPSSSLDAPQAAGHAVGMPECAELVEALAFDGRGRRLQRLGPASGEARRGGRFARHARKIGRDLGGSLCERGHRVGGRRRDRGVEVERRLEHHRHDVIAAPHAPEPTGFGMRGALVQQGEEEVVLAGLRAEELSRLLQHLRRVIGELHVHRLIVAATDACGGRVSCRSCSSCDPS